MKQGDAQDLHTLPNRHQGMTKFMEQHRGEQEQRREQRQPPTQGNRLNGGGISRLKQGCEDRNRKQPGGLNPQGNSHDLEQLPTFSHH